MRHTVFLFTYLLFISSSVAPTPPSQEKINGITMVGSPIEFEKNPIPAILAINAEWISLVPYGFTPEGKPNVYYNSPHQWWGETPHGIRESAKLAHDKGMKVMLKPQVFIPGSWVGAMEFETEEEWLIWEKDYTSYIMTLLQVAIDEKIELFCVGTEYKIAIVKREQFWRKLIHDIREVYPGKLIYSSNWDAYDNVPFWNALDYIGISAYFPLTPSKTPTVDELSEAWKPVIENLRKTSKKHNKKIVFTEYGYLSVDGCAYKTWLLEKEVHSLPINQKAQANAYEALYKNLLKEDFWMGGFLWKWFPNGKGHEGYVPRDYTPQNKLSEKVVREWYLKF